MDHDLFDGSAAAERNAPDYIAWHVSRAGQPGNRTTRWTRIGAAWTHRDGKGLNLQLHLLPAIGGRIVLRCPKAAGDADGNRQQDA